VKNKLHRSDQLNSWIFFELGRIGRRIHSLRVYFLFEQINFENE